MSSQELFGVTENDGERPPIQRLKSRSSTLRRLMSSRSVSLKRKVNVVLPHWMTDDLINETHDTLFSSSAPRELLRSQNLTMQTELRLWTMMRDLLAKQNLGGDEMEEGYIEERSNQIVQFLLHQQDDGRRNHGPHHDWMRVPDPVGALPLHSCFLLGVPHLGKKLIERFYNSPMLLSLPYMSDFEVWKDVGVVQERDGIDDGGLYTGETVLHIAIINDDIETVTWILERDADIGSRAHGAFFSPEVVRKEVDKAPSIWQRLLAWVQDRDLVNDPIVATTTNKDSACYYGEFPLSFAVCMGNIDICNLLVEHFRKRLGKNDPSVAKMYDYLSTMPTSEGKEMRAFSKRTKSVKKLDIYNERQLKNHAAFKPGQPLDFFISAQDSHGNTAMHLAVLHGRKESIDWIAAQPGGKLSLELLNNDGFTPLTLAARLGSVKMFHHVLECMRETVWSYGNVHMTKTSLLQIDTFRVKGSILHQRPKWRSALDIIVRHEIEDFSADELFNKLISSKWDRFGRSMYIWRTFIPYCIILIVFSTMLTLECARQRNKWNKQLVDGPWVSDEGISFNNIQSPERWTSNVLQTFLLVVGVPWLTVMGWKLRRLGPKDYDPNEDGDISAEEVMFFVFKNSSFFLDFSAAITICVAYFLGFERQLEYERYTLQMWAVTSILLWCNFLNVIMPFEFFGILVIIMYKMLIGDFFKFFAVYTIMILAFSQAMFCLFQMPDFPSESLRIDQDPFQAFLKLVWVSLGDVDSTALVSQTEEPSLTLTIYMIWVMLSTVLLINLLIAMMGQTFRSDMEDTHKTWIFPFAHLVLTYEKMLSNDQKAKLRTGHPRQTFTEKQEEADAEPAQRNEPFFEIAVEENKQKLTRAQKIIEERRANKLILEQIHEYGLEMRDCVESLRAIKHGIDNATAKTAERKDDS